MASELYSHRSPSVFFFCLGSLHCSVVAARRGGRDAGAGRGVVVGAGVGSGRRAVGAVFLLAILALLL